MKSVAAVAVALVGLLSLVNAEAQDYCATNPQISPYEVCYHSLGEALGHLKKDVLPNGRRRFLEPIEDSTFSQGSSSLSIFTRYYTPGFQPETELATWFNGAAQAGNYVSDREPDPPILVPGLESEGIIGFETEEELIAAIDEHHGPGTLQGAFRSVPGRDVIVRPDSLGRAQIYFDFNNAPGNDRRYITEFRNWDLRMYSRWWCPRGLDKGTVDEWCTNEETGNLRVKKVPQASCPTSGLPCVPATGAKELHETDFIWGAWPFTRYYSSLGGATHRPSVGYHIAGTQWSHSFQSSLYAYPVGFPRSYGIDAKRNVESYRRISATLLRSENEPGVAMIATGDAALPWKLSKPDGREEFFDDLGRLKRITKLESPADSLTFTYCGSTAFSAGLCSAKGMLWKATDGRGRFLEFVYSPRQFVGGVEDSIVKPARLIAVLSDGAPLAEYGYDNEGRMTGVTYPDATEKTYHYQELANLCRDSAGNPLSPCFPERMPSHLTGVSEDGVRLSHYTYDDLGRVTSSEWAGGAFPEMLKYPTATTREFTYPDGRVQTLVLANKFGFQKVTSQSDQAGSITKVYDADGRVTSETDRRVSSDTQSYALRRHLPLRTLVGVSGVSAARC
jgi:YD repeat-containing protein